MTFLSDDRLDIALLEQLARLGYVCASDDLSVPTTPVTWLAKTSRTAKTSAARRWHSISMTLPSHGASAQPIPGPAAAALLNEMPLFHQRPKMLLERVAVAAGQADGFAHGDAAMFARELDNLQRERG